MAPPASVILLQLLLVALAGYSVSQSVPASGQQQPHPADQSAEQAAREKLGPFFNGDKDVKLKLFTQANPDKYQLLKPDNKSAPNFDPKNPTRFIIHGWVDNGMKLEQFSEAYMATGLQFNVVIVDWWKKAMGEYATCKKHSRRVGEYLAEVIKYMMAERGLSLDDVYIIGHSLGAHSAGVAGNRLKGDVAVIIGLDPAAPLFGTTTLPNRLDRSDARLVVGIHTNGGLLGWKDSIGHVDFFPAGGSSQNGCELIDIGGVCSHNRAPKYYAESIAVNKFYATKCNSYKSYKKGSCKDNDHVDMGEWMPHNTTEGDYYLKLNKRSPHGVGDVGL